MPPPVATMAKLDPPERRPELPPTLRGYDPDPYGKPPLGVAGRLLRGSHRASRLKSIRRSGGRESRSRRSRPVISTLPSSVNCRRRTCAMAHQIADEGRGQQVSKARRQGKVALRDRVNLVRKKLPGDGSGDGAAPRAAPRRSPPFPPSPRNAPGRRPHRDVANVGPRRTRFRRAARGRACRLPPPATAN